VRTRVMPESCPHFHGTLSPFPMPIWCRCPFGANISFSFNSPKGHLELAGLGIEYCWAQAKYDFRKQNAMNAARAAFVEDLHKRVVKALTGIDVLRVRRFARKTREYMRTYARVHGLFGWESESDRLEGHAAVEKFVKKAKTHRCILDQDKSVATAYATT
jgi:hypothetical protein